MRHKTLESLTVKNFKCFENLSLQFGKLSVFSGHNGSGKSTAIQPVLLLAQNMRSQNRQMNGNGRVWKLNGELAKLGTFGEVLSKQNNASEIEFDFGFSDNSNLKCLLRTDRNKILTAKLNDNKLFGELQSVSDLCYIGAIRGITGDSNSKKQSAVHDKINVGVHGENSNNVYYSMSAEDRFQFNVNYWLGHISKGAQATVTAHMDSSNLDLRFKRSEISEWYSPANVGFGLTHAFPVIVASIVAADGDLLIVDRPEANLHPCAQSIMGRLLSETAARGVQVILETHSDHVLNGIRLSVKEKVLNPDDLRILFFSASDPNVDSHGVTSIKIDRHGKLDAWPDGFFDQLEIDTLNLIGVD